MVPFHAGDDPGGLLAAIVDASEDAIIGKDLSGLITSWSRGAERQYGYTSAETTGRSVSLLIPSERAEEFQGILARVNAGERVGPFDTVRRARDGSLLDVTLTVTPIRNAAGDVIGSVAVGRDITARNRASSDLATSELRWKAIVESTVDGMVVIDATGRIESINPAAERLFGYRALEVLGKNVSMLMPSPYHEEHDGYLAAYIATGVAKIIGKGRQVTGRRRDGSVFPLHLSVGEASIGGERKFTGILHDLSERVRLEEQLRGSEARWRSIVESAVDGIVLIDAKGHIEAFNPAAERLFGYREEEVIGRNVNILMPSPYHEEHDGYLGRYLATGEQKIIGVGREVTGLKKDGTTFPLHLSVGEVLLEGERKFTGILHDLSDRVRMEERLREQAALASLGEMAAVIAHEVKNPLAGIRGAIQVIAGRLPSESRDAVVATEVIARIDALNALMKDLLLFARAPHLKPTPVDVKALVASTADLLSRDPGFRNVRVDIGGSEPLVGADADLLSIVFMNLMVNGAQAMHGAGVIQVSVDAVDHGCRVAFKDQGPGIPVEIREKIFSPFFTTKSRGTGLGLPTARRLVEAHSGTISVDCPPGGGTTVTVQLPA